MFNNVLLCINYIHSYILVVLNENMFSCPQHHKFCTSYIMTSCDGHDFGLARLLIVCILVAESTVYLSEEPHFNNTFAS